MKYTIDYFIEKFEAIPEEQWCTDVFFNDNGQMCALGHCGANLFDEDSEASVLSYMFNLTISKINDGEDLNYQQPTPKQRILAALRDAKLKG